MAKHMNGETPARNTGEFQKVQSYTEASITPIGVIEV